MLETDTTAIHLELLRLTKEDLKGMEDFTEKLIVEIRCET